MSDICVCKLKWAALDSPRGGCQGAASTADGEHTMERARLRTGRVYSRTTAPSDEYRTTRLLQ